MKIPETGNVGTYYGEENGQWQPNGMIIDNGVGGGVVGSGDAGVLRPPAPVYPVHLPRGGPMGGYVMAGAYYPAAYPAVATPQDDFADYMWMENEEEFDKQVMQQLEEEALMEQCIEAMLEDEQRERHRRTNGHNNNNGPTTSNSSNTASLQEAVSRSTLNPLAAEFVPGRARQPPEERSDPPESKEPELQVEVQTPSETVESTETEVKIDDKESLPQTDPPEVSAADIQPIEDDKRSKEKLRPKVDTKKAKAETKPKAKVESKAKKDVKVKSVSEVKTSEVKNEVSVQSETSVTCEEGQEESIEVVKQSSPPPTEEPSTGFKPINYAAAAKANKPKKATTPPTTTVPEKITPPALKIEKSKEKVLTKTTPKVKTDKPIPRKNSTKVTSHNHQMPVATPKMRFQPAVGSEIKVFIENIPRPIAGYAMCISFI
ncbi:unnamed protein product [Leptosia nina]|uniref:Ataxin-2 C-terminal domain-containing protein n=1 Tax=Leptosia nina TaxID=320188 RepID=A0AAV1JGW2_9NEOP